MALSTGGGVDRVIFGLGTGDVAFTSGFTDISNAGDIYCDTFSLSGGATVNAYGIRIFARKSISIAAGCILSGVGIAASGNTAGVGPGFGIAGNLQSGSSGGNGGSGGAVGSVGTNFSGSTRGIGGNGAAGGSSGTHAGGTGGATLVADLVGLQKNYGFLLQGWCYVGNTQYWFGGGAGGGGGGGETASGGGGGGAGGNTLFLASPNITNLGTITCKGGTGAAGNSAGNNGGGAGGGGGSIILLYGALNPGTLDVSGGVGGAGHGAGSAGSNGSAGHIYYLNGLSTAPGPIGP